MRLPALGNRSVVSFVCRESEKRGRIFFNVCDRAYLAAWDSGNISMVRPVGDKGLYFWHCEVKCTYIRFDNRVIGY